MTRESQKEHERRLLDGFLELIGLTDSVEDIEAGESPDFTFTIEGSRVGTEMTEYHDPEEVNEKGIPRRGVEAQWEELKEELTEARPGDLEGVFVHLSFRELELPRRKEQPYFIAQLYEALRVRETEISKGGCRFQPDADQFPLLARYVQTIDARWVNAWSEPGSNIYADAVGTDEGRLVNALSPKLTQDRPSRLDACWLVICTGWRISQMTGWMFVESLHDYDCLNLLLKQSPYDRVYFVEWDNSRVFRWSRGEGWIIEVGTRYPHGDEPDGEVDSAE